MTVEPGHAGRPFVQLTRRLGIHNASRGDRKSERPHDAYRDEDGGLTGVRYLDRDEPTLVEFYEDDDNVDVPGLLRAGAIRELTPAEFKGAESDLLKANKASTVTKAKAASDG